MPTDPTRSTLDDTSTQAPARRRAATLGLAGAAITVVGGAVSQILRASSTVPDDRWSFPYSARAHVLLAVVWGLTHVLIYVGLNGLRRSGLLGERRAGTVGIGLALAGTALLGAGEIASMWLGTAKEDSGGAVLVGSVFGVGTLLTAVGMIWIGVSVLRDRRWVGAGRVAPLGFGLLSVVQMALAPTDLFHVGIVVYGLGALGLMVALRAELGAGSPAVSSMRTSTAN